MRPDRRDFAEPGDLIVTAAKNTFVIDQLIHNEERWSWRDGLNAPRVSADLPAIVVGSLPQHLAWDMSGNLTGGHPNTNVGIPKFVVMPTTMGWLIHQGVGVDTKHMGARTVEDERSETLENNE